MRNVIFAVTACILFFAFTTFIELKVNSFVAEETIEETSEDVLESSLPCREKLFVIMCILSLIVLLVLGAMCLIYLYVGVLDA